MMFKSLLACIFPKKALTITKQTTFKDVLHLMQTTKETVVVLLENEYPKGIFTERDVTRCLAKGLSLEEPVYPYVSKNLVKIKKDRPVAIAINLMVEYFIRRLIVVDHEDRYVGIITYKDLFDFIDKEIFKKELTVGEFILNKPFYYLSPDNTLYEALKLMSEKNIGAIPILDHEFYPVGIVTEKDFIFNFPSLDLSERLEKIALKPVQTVSLTNTVSYVKQRFEQTNLNHLVVVDDKGKAVGIVSTRDFLVNAKENYAIYMENKFKQAKDLLYILPEISLEILDLGYDQVIYWGSAKAQEILGESLKDKSIGDIFPEDEWLKLYGKLKKTGNIHREKIRSLNGKIFEVSGSYIKLQLEGEGRIHLIMRDVSVDQKVLKDLKTEMDSVRTLLDSLDSLLLLVDSETGGIKFYNQTAINYLGFSKEEIENKTIFEIFYYPYEKVKVNLDEVSKEGKEIKGDRLLITAKGTTLPVEIRMFKLETQPNYVVITGRYKPFYNAELFIKTLSFCKSTEEALESLERYILEFADYISFIEIDPEKKLILSTKVSGERVFDKPCLIEDLEMCRVYRTGVSLSKAQLVCPFIPKFIEGDWFCYPLILEGKLVGIFKIAKKKPFNEIEITNFQNIFHNFSFYFHNLKLLRELEELSVRDYLTGVYNRKFLMEVIEKELKFGKRKKTTFSLILIDLDNFKAVNDTLGHYAGDLVLKGVAELLSQSLREMDIIGRWGGEEFLVILRETQKMEAVRIAERLRFIVEHTPIKYQHFSIHITASFGVANFPEDATSLIELYKLVDERLYKAKEFGKNIVVAD